jgi:hypothetical protein
MNICLVQLFAAFIFLVFAFMPTHLYLKISIHAQISIYAHIYIYIYIYILVVS